MLIAVALKIHSKIQMKGLLDDVIKKIGAEKVNKINFDNNFAFNNT